MKKIFSALFIAGVLSFNLSAVADETATHDPFEKTNRAVLNFNLKVDRAIVKPTAKTYAKLPRPVRKGVGNFFANLREPGTVVNDLLQGKFVAAARDSGRFVINSTLGFFGVFDFAGAIGMPRRSEDFGQTLAVWGVPAGPYLVLPLLGPRNLRDAAGMVPEYAAGTDLLQYADSPTREYATALRLVDAPRARARRR